jgi:hypothetical protein
MKYLSAALLFIMTSCYSHADEQYIFDVLKNPVYRSSWDLLLQMERAESTWLNANDNVSTPSQSFLIKSDHYDIFEMCAPHDCIENHFYVIFSKDGTNAWGLLISENYPRFFGRPDDSIRDKLLSFSQIN